MLAREGHGCIYPLKWTHLCWKAFSINGMLRTLRWIMTPMCMKLPQFKLSFIQWSSFQGYFENMFLLINIIFKNQRWIFYNSLWNFYLKTIQKNYLILIRILKLGSIMWFILDLYLHIYLGLIYIAFEAHLQLRFSGPMNMIVIDLSRI